MPWHGQPGQSCQGPQPQNQGSEAAPLQSKAWRRAKRGPSPSYTSALIDTEDLGKGGSPGAREGLGTWL